MFLKTVLREQILKTHITSFWGFLENCSYCLNLVFSVFSVFSEQTKNRELNMFSLFFRTKNSFQKAITIMILEKVFFNDG